MLTRAQALTADVFHYGTCSPRYVERWRRNGRTKVWVTRPNEYRVPVKHGLYRYGAITQSDASDVHVASECPHGH